MTIVFTNGVFDLIHAGHIKLLKEAKELGDELHVGINSDRSVAHIKGPDRPIIPEGQRYEMLSSIKYVDRVYVFDDLTPINLIKEIMPDIVVKGGDWKEEDVVGKDYSKVVTIPTVPHISTTEIIKRIQTFSNIHRFLK